MLRDANEMLGLAVAATDGDVGHVRDCYFDDEAWVIRYLVVNTSNWWRGHQVFIAAELITEVSWLDRKVVLDWTRQGIQKAPSYDRALLPDRSSKTLVYERPRALC